MTTEDYLKDIREFYENFSAQSARAWEVQQEFYRDFGERQTEVFNAITQERLSSLKQLPEIETPTQLFELGIELEESTRDQLTRLHADNTAALEKHFRDLAGVFAPAKTPAKKRAKSAA